MKILVLGHARHGKDILATILAKELNLKVVSATYIAGRDIVYPKMKEQYKSLSQCIEDRGNHREEWFNLIKEYNTPDLTRHVKDVLKTSDIYIGLRSKEELEACKREKVFGLIVGIWDENKVLEDKSSMDINTFEECNVLVMARDSIDKLRKGVVRLKNKGMFLRDGND